MTAALGKRHARHSVANRMAQAATFSSDVRHEILRTQPDSSFTQPISRSLNGAEGASRQDATLELSYDPDFAQRNHHAKQVGISAIRLQLATPDDVRLVRRRSQRGATTRCCSKSRA